MLGYGGSGLGTLIPSGASPTNKPITVYFRKEFVVNDPLSAIRNLRLDALYDDGFVLYLNGAEILRSDSMPGGAITFNTPASASYNSVGYDVFDLSAHIPRLRVGNNLLCAEVHQVSSSSDDLLWDASLTFDVSTQPTVARPTITPNGGTFTAPVQVSISTVPSDATIYYTVNGTDPDESSTRYTGPFTVETTTEVRARAFKPGYNESPIAVATFLFPGPGVLDISPDTGLTSSGTRGGPFTPASKIYTLTNSGGVPLNWTGAVSQSWLSLSRTNGTLAGGTSTNITLSFNAAADSLSAGNYSASVNFANSTSGSQPLARPIQLAVSEIRLSLMFSSEQFQITLHGHANTTYVVEASTNLIHWTALATNTAGANGLSNYIDSDSAADPHRFYRARPQQ